VAFLFRSLGPRLSRCSAEDDEESTVGKRSVPTTPPPPADIHQPGKPKSLLTSCALNPASGGKMREAKSRVPLKRQPISVAS
jgi:hypothetical protein